jgi:bacillithiol biosynthesis deacetylase BshB1
MRDMSVDILAIAAHPDDIELGASGTLLKHIEAGYTVAIVDLTEGELGSRGTVETRYDEASEASRLMGIKWRENLQMKDGFFEINEANKRLIIEQIRRAKPKIVLANAIDDRHPDHGRAGQLIKEACFLAGLRKIETTWDGKEQEAHRPDAVYHYIQDRYLKPDLVVDVSNYVEKKFEVIKAYKSQFYDPNSAEPETPISGRSFLEFVEARMREMGRQAGYEYAEGFTVERFIGVRNLFDID